MGTLRRKPILSSIAVLLLLGILAAAPGAAKVLPCQGSSPQASSQKLPRGVTFVTSVEGITEYQLENGLRVLLFPDPSKQTTTVNSTYLVGSRHENYGETGMAHLLEHLAFKGTPNHPNIPQELTEHGSRPNGSTWFDRTNYFETFPATDVNLDWAISLEADRMVNSFIAKKDLDSEMTVVRNEYELGENSPFGVTLKRIFGAAFDWHNYSKDTIGARSDIENVPIDRLQAFYRKYYQPDNSVLLVAGRFDPEKALSLIVARFGAIPRPSRVLPPVYTAEPPQDGEHTVTVRRVGDTQLVAAAYHVPPGAHEDFAALDILTQVLGDTPAGRLHKALVETKKAAASGGFGFQLHDPGLAIFFAQVRKENPLSVAKEALLQTVEGLPAAPATAEEIERARMSILKNFELTLNQSDRVGLELSEWMAMGDWRLFFLHRDRIKKVTAEDVARVAAAYLRPNNRTVGEFIPTEKPERVGIPGAPDIASLVKDYKGGAAIEAGEAFDPSPSNIASRLQVFQLPAGVRLGLLPKKTRGNTVVASMTFRFGDEISLKNRRTAAIFAGQMLMRGTAKHTRQQIQDELDRLKARLGVFASRNGVTASLETIRANLPAVLKLLAEILREPAFPTSEFELLKQETLAAIESQRSEPGAVASTALERHLGPYPEDDVRYTETFEEQLAHTKAATVDDARQFYKDFYGASDANVAIVGDFDAQEIKTLIQELMAGWKSPRKYERIVIPYQDIQPVNQSLETPDKANAVFFAGMLLKLSDTDPDYAALALGNYMLGGGFLNSRLATRIRQKEGLSYGVGTGLSANGLNQYGRFSVSAIYAPQNVTKLEAAVKEELEKVLKDGFTAEELAAAKSGYLQSRQLSRSQDNELASRLALYLYYGRPITWDADLEKKIAELTPQQILDAMRQHIDPAKLTIIKAGDFSKTAPK